MLNIRYLVARYNLPLCPGDIRGECQLRHLYCRNRWNAPRAHEPGPASIDLHHDAVLRVERTLEPGSGRAIRAAVDLVDLCVRRLVEDRVVLDVVRGPVVGVKGGANGFERRFEAFTAVVQIRSCLFVNAVAPFVEVAGKVDEGGLRRGRCGFHHDVYEVGSSLDESRLFFVVEAGRIGLGTVSPVITNQLFFKDWRVRHDWMMILIWQYGNMQ